MQRTMRARNHFAPYYRTMILIIICFTLSCVITQFCYSKAKDKVNRLYSERFSRSVEVTSLSEELEYVRSDAYVERIARDEFGLIKPGEIRYVTN